MEGFFLEKNLFNFYIYRLAFILEAQDGIVGHGTNRRNIGQKNLSKDYITQIAFSRERRHTTFTNLGKYEMHPNVLIRKLNQE